MTFSDKPADIPCSADEKSSDKKTRTVKRITGDIGETAAVYFLKKNGYRIIGRNLTFGKKETDIIAEDRTYIIFCEVKTRTQSPDLPSNFGRPASAVNREKQKNLIEAARAYIAQKHPRKRVRFDVIEVYISPKDHNIVKIHHIPAAFTA